MISENSDDNILLKSIQSKHEQIIHNYRKPYFRILVLEEAERMSSENLNFPIYL